jgi:uncharacterized membrane protein YczE
MSNNASKEPKSGRKGSLLTILYPQRTIPHMRWTGTHRWDIAPARLAILFFGLAIFGFGDGLIIQSHIGNAPWSVLAQGLSHHTPLSIGECTFVIGFTVLLLWWPLKERPGFGTIANIAVISLFIQIAVDLVPLSTNNFPLSLLMVLLGISLVGAGSTLYITTGLGPGPRDGLMTALHHKTGVRVGRVRLGIEICALIIGALLGGTVGIGTALFALLIGNSVAIWLGIAKHFAGSNQSA